MSSDKFRLITVLVYQREGCRCIPKKQITTLPCACQSNPQVKEICIDDRYLKVLHLERRPLLTSGRCEQTVVSKEIKPIVLGKPKEDIRCNPHTHVQLVKQTTPIIENCHERIRASLLRQKCSTPCSSTPRLLRQSPCSVNCVQLQLWTRQVLGEDGQCKNVYRKITKNCCCQKPHRLETRCNAEQGVAEIGIRTYKLLQGRCVWDDKYITKRIECPENRRIIKYPQSNGLVRVEQRTNVMVNCRCVEKIHSTLQELACPNATTTKRCTSPEPGLFTIETVSTRWHLSDKSRTVCDRVDLIVDQAPVDCSATELIKSSRCDLDRLRHAYVRVDRLMSSSNDGCHCVPNPPKLEVHVCRCVEPTSEEKCSKPQGLMIQTVTKYELSGDRTRCIPHITKRVWKPDCDSSFVRYLGRTRCDPKTGKYYKRYAVKRKRDCSCVVQELRRPAYCQCPTPQRTTRCLGPTLREVTTSTFTLQPNGYCLKAVATHKEPVGCEPPASLLATSTIYSIERSRDKPQIIHHIYPCGTTGKCMQKVVEFTGVTNASCECHWISKEFTRSCCCPVGSSSQLTPYTEKCDEEKGVIVAVETEWKLDHSQCKPVSHERSRPVDCRQHRFAEPVELCRENGLQTYLVRDAARKGCKCFVRQRLSRKTCLCKTASTAEVVFLLDESMLARRTAREVAHVVRKIGGIFTRAAKLTPSSPGRYRFVLVIYGEETRVVYNLDANVNLEPIVHEIAKTEAGDYEPNSLKNAVYTILDKVIPHKRSGTPVLVYLLTDAFNVAKDVQSFANLRKTLEKAQAKISAILIGPVPHNARLLGNLISRPVSAHFIPIQTANRLATHLGQLVATTCMKVCPAPRIERSSCSHDTGCQGRAYLYSYHFDVKQGKCVGQRSVRTIRCCCPQRPQMLKSECINGRLMHTITKWQLTQNGLCESVTATRDVTSSVVAACSPVKSVHVGDCSTDGRAVEITTERRLENCHCKEKTFERVIRCGCVNKPVERKHCLAHNIELRELSTHHLVNGQCHPRKLLQKHKITCPQAIITRGDCDSMTCQRRLTIVTHVPKKCRCERQVQVKHITCCCRGTKTVQYEGCRYEVLKTFVENSVEPSVKSGSCVHRKRYHFEPVACPTNHHAIRHRCRQHSETDSESTQVDPALRYRLVEHMWWQIRSCECRKLRRVQFEACGCRHNSVTGNGDFVEKCSATDGVLTTFKRTLRLEVDGTKPSHIHAVVLPTLSHAKCRPEVTVTSVRRIVCPEAKQFRTGCQLESDGRMYERVQIHRWSRKACECISLPPELVQKTLCACRPRQAFKQCVPRQPGGPADRLVFKIVEEYLSNATQTDGTTSGMCKLAPFKLLKQDVACPKNQVHFSKCVNGQMRIQVRMSFVYQCKCHQRIRLIRSACDSSNKPNQFKGTVPSDAHPENAMVLPITQLTQCIDLLPSKKCDEIESRGFCERRGQMRDILCRKTCKQCSACPVERIKFRTNSEAAGEGCLSLKPRFNPQLILQRVRSDLANCKLLCARQAGCQSFDYYIPDSGSASTCILNRVDLQGFNRRISSSRSTGALMARQSIEKIKGSKCFFFQKICAPECPKPQKKVIQECSCRNFTHPHTDDSAIPRQVTHCWEKVIVRYFVHTPSGYCVMKQWEGRLPCRKSLPGYKSAIPSQVCEDNKPSVWCEAQISRNSNRCRQTEFQQACRKSCGACECRGELISRSHCGPQGIASETRVTYKALSNPNICTVEVQDRKIPCDYCPIGKFEVIHPCNQKTGQRLVARVQARIASDSSHPNKPRCLYRVERKRLSCAGCLTEQFDKQWLSGCRQHSPSMFRVTVFTDYVVNSGGCCRVKRSARSFPCDGCPPVQVEQTACSYGQRLRHIIYYTRPSFLPIGNKHSCIRRVITRRERCEDNSSVEQGNCEDQLTAVDCQTLKLRGGCNFDSGYARNLCRKTCGFCEHA